MIAVELIRRSRSAEAIGPCGSNTPAGAQEVRRIAAPTTHQRSRREQPSRNGGPAAPLIEIGHERCGLRGQKTLLTSDGSHRGFQCGAHTVASVTDSIVNQ